MLGYLLLFVFFLSACSDVIMGDKTEKKPPINDYCEAFGWYGDGRCDEDCPKPDPDCKPKKRKCSLRCEPGSVLVELSDGCVCRDLCEGKNLDDYQAFGDSCDDDEIATGCAEDSNAIPGREGASEYFRDECGCGCKPFACETLHPERGYVAYSEECLTIDFDCKLGYEPFDDECGCGCKPIACENLNPNRSYVAYGEECQLADFVCLQDWSRFQDECGCGCEEMEEPQCDYSDPSTLWYSADPEQCSLEGIRFDCPPDMIYFDNECGCGCVPQTPTECRGDQDCPEGYCQNFDSGSHCVFPECGNKPLQCDAAIEPCPIGQTRFWENGCSGECVSARTCQPT